MHIKIFNIEITFKYNNIENKVKDTLIKDDDRIKAIRLYRDLNYKDPGLLKAKNYIDKMYCKINCNNDEHVKKCVLKDIMYI
jgi:hypothetical protein